MTGSRSKSFAFSVFAITLLTYAALAAQRDRKAQTKGQTQFGPETPIARPVKLPQDVLEQLLEFKDEFVEDDVPRLRQWLKDNDETEADAPKYFAASDANINDDGAPDMIVQAESGPFVGAHLTTWWAFSKVEGRFGAALTPGYAIVFSGRGDGLRILKTSTYGYRDIETTNFAGAGTQFYIRVYKFEGQEYRPRVCTLENDGKKVRIPCD